MKKIVLNLIVFSFLLLPVIALGQIPTDVEPAPTTQPLVVLQNVINVMFTFLLVMAAIFIIVAAYMFVTAGGDPEKVGTARNLVMYAIIAIVIAVMAQGIVYFIRRSVA